MADEILGTLSTELGGASTYGAGAYGDGAYGAGAQNYVVFAVGPFGQVWEPDQIVINCDSASFTTFAAYLNIAEPTSCVGSSINGNQDVVGLPEIQLQANDYLICVWFGGDAGSIASASLIGTSGSLS